MASCQGNRWQPPAFIRLTLAPQRGRLQVRENLGDRGCGSDGEAAAQGEFPLSTLLLVLQLFSWCPHLFPLGLSRMAASTICSGT